MPCDEITIPGPGWDKKPSTAILCSRGRRRKAKPCNSCGTPGAGLLCDFELASGKTCDAPICGTCTVKPGPDIDYCPSHPLPSGGPRRG